MPICVVVVSNMNGLLSISWCVLVAWPTRLYLWDATMLLREHMCGHVVAAAQTPQLGNARAAQALVPQAPSSFWACSGRGAAALHFNGHM